MDNVNCRGNETTLVSCPHDPDTSDCFHFEDAGVSCAESPSELNKHVHITFIQSILIVFMISLCIKYGFCKHTFFLQWSVMIATSGLLVVMLPRGELRFVCLVSGALCAMTYGERQMLLWSADNWDYQLVSVSAAALSCVV